MNNFNESTEIKNLKQQSRAQNGISIITYSWSQLNRVYEQVCSDIVEVFQTMKKEKQYEKMTVKQIQDERIFLLKTIAELNQCVDKETSKRKNKDGSQRELSISKKTPMSIEMGLDYPSLCKEVKSNLLIISKLQKQYEQYTGVTNSVHNEPHKQNLIQEVKQQIKKMKQQIKNHKRSKHLREKQIIAGDEKQSIDYQSQLLHYQQQKQTLQLKLQMSEQKILESEVKVQMLKQESNHVYDHLHEYSRSNQAQVQHRRVLYETKKKKLALGLKGRHYQQHTNKRKYYGLLLQLQDCIDKISSIKLQSVQEEIEATKKQISRLKHVQQQSKTEKELICPITNQSSLFSHQRVSAPTGISLSEQTNKNTNMFKALRFSKGKISCKNMHENQKATQRISRIENNKINKLQKRILQNKLNKSNVFNTKNQEESTQNFQSKLFVNQKGVIKRQSAIKIHNLKIKLQRKIHTQGNLTQQRSSYLKQDSYRDDFQQQQTTEKE